MAKKTPSQAKSPMTAVNFKREVAAIRRKGISILLERKDND